MKEVSIADVVKYSVSEKWYDHEVAGNVTHTGTVGNTV